VVVVLFMVFDPEAGPPPRTGWILTGSPRDFPTLLETDRSLLRTQVNVRVGWFSDHNPWWGDAEAFVGGSPLYPDPAGPGWASWGEVAVEAGVHGASQLGARPVYAFGNLTGLAAGSAGQDPWRSDSRFESELEQAYGGLLAVSSTKDLGFTVSYGRQPWQLNNGFLFSRATGSYNRAEWGASYLNPRTALERTFLAKLRWSKLSVEAFLIDPGELPQ
jgi:hypothetical protein